MMLEGDIRAVLVFDRLLSQDECTAILSGAKELSYECTSEELLERASKLLGRPLRQR